jgi:molybdopterin-guanine dinucleotide biosynthesis protein B
MKLFSLVGWSGSGKTTLIARLISYYKKKKMSVAAVKRVPHEYSLQPEGKDSFRFLRAGADSVYLASQREIMSIRPKQAHEDAWHLIKSDLKDHDFVLLEGLILDQVPVAEVFDSRRHKLLKFPLKKLSLIISDEQLQEKIPWFHVDDIKGIAEYLEEYAYE